MAVFNPAVSPTQDPNYLNYSRVIDAPAPNMSGKIGLETAAVGLDSAVTITDQAIKKGISDSAYAAVDPLRDQMTAGLEQIKSDLNKGVIPQPVQGVAGATTGKSWLDANALADAEDNLPVGLQEGLSGVTALANAKAAGSPKLNDTKYAGDVLAEAKRLRNQYGPGYREYIDQKISEASGLPVANSYYNNMLLDINRQMAQMTKVKDDIGNSLIKSNDMPGQADLLLKYKANPSDTNLQSEILHKINDWENLKSRSSLDAADRARTDWNNKDIVTKQTESMGRNLNTAVQMHMSALKDASLPSGGTGKDLTEFLSEYATGKHPGISETEFNQRRLQYNNWVATVERSVTAQAAQYSPLIGDVSTAVKNAMAPIYAQQKFFNNKEDGPGYFVTRQVEHIKADATSGILLNKDYGKEATQMLGARAVLGEQYFPQWLTTMNAEGTIDKFKGIVSQEGMSAIQPYTDSRGTPIPRVMKDAIVNGKKIGADGDSGYYGTITNFITKVADPNMNLAAKDRLIEWGFSSKNVGRLEELKMDYRDPQTGKMVEGRYRMFNILSSHGVVQGVKETALVKPENYTKFQRTLEIEFGRLYRSSMQDLNKIVAEEGRVSGQGTVSLDEAAVNNNKSSLAFSFNDKTNSFGIVDKNNKPITRDNLTIRDPKYSLYSGMLDRLDLVNSGIANLANVQRNNPKQGAENDTSTYLLQVLQTTGFRPGSNITGATEGMAKALIRARNPEMTPQELDKAILGPQPAARSNFTQEEDRSLAAFLRSPAGQAQGAPRRGVIKGNLSDETLLNVQTDEIPEGMSARDFIKMLREGKKLGGSVQ